MYTCPDCGGFKVEPVNKDFLICIECPEVFTKEESLT